MKLSTFSIVAGLSLSSTVLASSNGVGQPLFPRHSVFPRQSNSTSNSTGTPSTAPCVPENAVHMIVARASTEQPGEGIIGAVATSVKNAVAGSDSEAVVYPATLTDYFNSEASGVAAMQSLIEAYATRCPTSKMALLGYSQGAQVAADVLCGNSENGFNGTKPLSESLSKNIVAVVMMGDPSHMPNLSQDVGNSTKAGIFPRNNTAACGSTAAITQSYCNSDDKFCDSGSSLAVHISYVQVYGSAASQFIIDNVSGKGAKTNTTGSSVNGNSTGTGTGKSQAAPRLSGDSIWLAVFACLVVVLVV